MKKLIASLFMLLGAWGANAQCYRMVWADEFSTNGLPDSQKWSYDIGGSGWGNNELQYYTDKRSENARIDDGKLIIEARKEPFGNSQYTSARLVSKEKGDWLYGKVVVRAKLPQGRGTWPAIWMLPTDWAYGGWPMSGEIDIMEHVGYDMGKIHGTVHTDAFNHTKNTQKGGSTSVLDAHTAFHDYSIEWTPSKIDFFVDGTKYFTFDKLSNATFATWPFDKRFHLILNIAIGGSWGGAQGIDDSIFPQKMEVDYVRVYQQVDSIAIDGPKYVTVGQVASYHVDGAIDGTFTWEAPQGAQIVSGQGTNDVTVNWQQAEGNLIVKSVVECQTLSDTLKVTQITQPSGNGWLLEDFNNGQLLDWKAPQGTPNNFVLLENDGALKIDFNVTKPSDNPNATFTIDHPVNLSGYSELWARVKTANKSKTIVSRIDLVDTKGKQTNIAPVFNLTPLIDDGEYYTYRFNFADSYKAAGVDGTQIEKLIFYVNFGVFGEVGKDSLWIDYLEMKVPSTNLPPNRPSHLTAQAQTGGVALTWRDRSNNETGFIVQRSTQASSGFTTIADNVAANALTYTDATAQAGTNYYYRVLSKNAQGNSEHSNIVPSNNIVSAVEELPQDFLNVWPNPTQDELFFQVPQAHWTYRVANMQGQIFMEGKNSQRQGQLSLKQLPKGIYLFVMQSELGWIQRKILLQ